MIGNSLSSRSDPVAGEFGGQLSNSQPEEPTWPGGKSKEPEPDLFSAGADMITYVWNMIYKEEQERMYVYRCVYIKMWWCSSFRSLLQDQKEKTRLTL